MSGDDAIRLTLGRALAEMNRRNDALAAVDGREPLDWMKPVEAIVVHTDLRHADIVAGAERLARCGRKANVTLVILVPDPETVTVMDLGSSLMLREFAVDGRTVRLAAIR